MEPNIIIVVCIYDRFENLRRWIHAWQQCEQLGAKLFFVNNSYKGFDSNFWKDYCSVRGVEYIIRKNIGFETAIIQDVISKKIIDDVDWDVLFFFTDDTIPMTKGFLEKYTQELLKPDVGVVCMEVSGNYTPHIRTTGWCITKETSKNIYFSANPVITKEDCYNFEHTGGEHTLMSQILRLGKRVVQQSNIENSTIWDTDHTKLNRWEEWHKEFPGYK